MTRPYNLTARKLKNIFWGILLILVTVPMPIAIGQTQSGALPAVGNAMDTLQILSTTADTLTARFTLPELKITTHADATEAETSGVLMDIRFAGADWTLDVGKPRLPVYTQRLGIPVAGTPVVTIVQARSEIRTVENVRVTPDDPIFSTLDATVPAQVSSGFYPTRLVEVIPGGFVRDQRIGSLQINPVQYNPATKQLKIFPSVTFRVHFPNAAAMHSTAAAAAAPFRESSPTFENLFRGMLRNYEQARLWRKQRRGPSSSAYGNHVPSAPTAINANTRRFKITVTQTDMYRITYNNIKVHTGIEPERVNLDTLRLENGGKKQGLYVFDDNENDTLDPGEQIIFYGRALTDNKFTDENVYWLRFGLRDEPATELEGSRVPVRDATPQQHNSVPPKGFFTRVRFEENRHHDVLAGRDVKSELADHYFGVAFRGGNIDTSRKDFRIELPMAVPRRQINRKSILRIKFQGASRKGGARHVARISFNNHVLGRDEVWKRQASQIATRDIPADRIYHNEDNYMRIQEYDNNDTPPGSYDFYLDWYELEYWRTFQAEFNRLEFNTNYRTAQPGTSSIPGRKYF